MVLTNFLQFLVFGQTFKTNYLFCEGIITFTTSNNFLFRLQFTHKPNYHFYKVNECSSNIKNSPRFPNKPVTFCLSLQMSPWVRIWLKDRWRGRFLLLQTSPNPRIPIVLLIKWWKGWGDRTCHNPISKSLRRAHLRLSYNYPMPVVTWEISSLKKYFFILDSGKTFVEWILFNPHPVWFGKLAGLDTLGVLNHPPLWVPFIGFCVEKVICASTDMIFCTCYECVGPYPRASRITIGEATQRNHKDLYSLW